MLICPTCGCENREDARFCNECGYVVKDTLKGNGTLGRGLFFNNYHILGSKNLEASESLYVVENNHEKTKKFIKEIITVLPDEKSHQKGIERFYREIEILSKISHPYFPAITDYFIEKGRYFSAYYIVFKYSEGEILDKIVNSFNKISEEFVINLGCKLCDIIDELHRKKPAIYCYNLSPSNILVREDGDILLLDIPVSRNSQVSAILPGRVEFIAPEKFEYKILPESDIYSLGVILHYILTNIRSTPFIFKPVKSVRQEISEDLSRVISTAISLKPDRRFKSLTDMKKALMFKGQENKLLPLNNYITDKKDIEPAFNSKSYEEIKPLVKMPAKYPEEIKPPVLKYTEEVKPAYQKYSDNIKPPASSFTSSRMIEEKSPVTRTVLAENQQKEDKKIDSELFLWYFQTGDKISSSPAISSDTLFIGSDDKNIYAIDAINGKEKWHFPTGSWVSTTPVFQNDRTYIGGRDGHIYCINAITGKTEWKFKSEASTFHNPSVTSDTMIIGASLFERTDYTDVILALDINDGSKKWMVNTGGAIFYSPFILGEHAYIGTENGNIISFDVKTGKENWKFDLEGRIYSTPVISEDIIYIACEGILKNGCVYLLNAEDGRFIWRIEFDKPFRSSVCVGEDIIYVASLDKHVYAVDLTERKILWSFKTGGGIRSTPLLFENTVYTGSDDGYFYAINATTGQEIWKFQTDGAIRSSPVILNNIIYFGSRDGKVYALKSLKDAEVPRPSYNEAKSDEDNLISSCNDDKAETNGEKLKYLKEKFEEEAYTEVIESLEQMEDLEVSYLIMLGDSYKETGELDKSIKIYEKATNLENSIPSLYVKLGKVYALKGDVDSALISYDMALELDNNFIDALLGKIQIFIIGKKYEDALSIVSQCEKLNHAEHEKMLQSRKIQIFLELGRHYLEKNELVTAIQYIEKAEKLPLSERQVDTLKKYKAQVFFKLGEKYGASKNTVKSIEFYKMCEETYPHSELAECARKEREKQM